MSHLCRHAVEALRASFGSGERHIGYSARNSPVSVIKGMDGDKPQMRQPGFQNRGRILYAIEPLQECSHLSVQSLGRRRFVIDTLLADGAGDDLHGTTAVVTLCAGLDLRHAAPPRRKQGRMPVEQSLSG